MSLPVQPTSVAPGAVPVAVPVAVVPVAVVPVAVPVAVVVSVLVTVLVAVLVTVLVAMPSAAEARPSWDVSRWTLSATLDGAELDPEGWYEPVLNCFADSPLEAIYEGRLLASATVEPADDKGKARVLWHAAQLIDRSAARCLKPLVASVSTPRSGGSRGAPALLRVRLETAAPPPITPIYEETWQALARAPSTRLNRCLDDGAAGSDKAAELDVHLLFAASGRVVSIDVEASNRGAVEGEAARCAALALYSLYVGRASTRLREVRLRASGRPGGKHAGLERLDEAPLLAVLSDSAQVVTAPPERTVPLAEPDEAPEDPALAELDPPTRALVRFLARGSDDEVLAWIDQAALQSIQPHPYVVRRLAEHDSAVVRRGCLPLLLPPEFAPSDPSPSPPWHIDAVLALLPDVDSAGRSLIGRRIGEALTEDAAVWRPWAPVALRLVAAPVALADDLAAAEHVAYGLAFSQLPEADAALTKLLETGSEHAPVQTRWVDALETRVEDGTWDERTQHLLARSGVLSSVPDGSRASKLLIRTQGKAQQ